MRRVGDHRSDAVSKPELFMNESGVQLTDVAFVLEDRAKVTAAWRKLGLRVLQVAEGDY